MSLIFNSVEYKLSEFFNPNINKNFEVYRSGVDIKTLKVLLSEVYSKQNILKYPFGFFRKLTSTFFKRDFESTEKDFNCLVDSIKDEEKWVLHFFILETNRQLRIPRFSKKSFTDSSKTYHLSNSIEEWEPVNLPHNQPPEIQDIVKNFIKDFDSAFPNENFNISQECLLLDHNGFLVRNILWYLFDSPVLYTNTTAERPSRISSPNVIIRFSVSENDIFNGNNHKIKVLEIATKNYRNPIYNLLNYSAQATDLINWPITEPYEKSPRLYGVELECSTDLTVRQVIDAQVEPFFICKQDGSISGTKKGKYEMVTVPMTLKAHKKHWAHWFKNIDYNNFDCTDKTTNGFHVHIDRKAFNGNKHLQNMTWFYNYPANTDFILAISERGSLKKMSEYSAFIDFKQSPVSKIKSFERVVTLTRNLSKYSAVNVSKQLTIEIRIFRGIISFAELVKNLEFVDAVFEFTFSNHTPDTLRLSKFIQWLDSQPKNKYKTLKEFIFNIKDFDKMLLRSEIQNTIFNITDPVKIAERLNKAFSNITNAHVSVINKNLKRTFVLNKEGYIEVTRNDRGKIAYLDKPLEKAYTRQTI